MSPTNYPEPQHERSGLKTALVAGALIALVAANIYLYVQLDHVRTDLAATRGTLTAELASLRDASAGLFAAIAPSSISGSALARVRL